MVSLLKDIPPGNIFTPYKGPENGFPEHTGKLHGLATEESGPLWCITEKSLIGYRSYSLADGCTTEFMEGITTGYEYVPYTNHSLSLCGKTVAVIESTTEGLHWKKMDERPVFGCFHFNSQSVYGPLCSTYYLDSTDILVPLGSQEMVLNLMNYWIMAAYAAH